MQTEELIGIDPDETLEFTFRGARFILGVVDAATWEPLHHRFLMALRDARRRVIAQSPEEGEDSDSWALKVASDPQYKADVAPVFLEVTRKCVRGHDRFVRKGGTPIPFKLENGSVSADTMRWYSMVPGLAEAIFQAVRPMHVLSPNAKKD